MLLTPPRWWLTDRLGDRRPQFENRFFFSVPKTTCTPATLVGEACYQRARDALLWPGIKAEMKGFPANRSPCHEYSRAQQKESMMSRDTAACPRQPASAGVDSYAGSGFFPRCCRPLLGLLGNWPSARPVSGYSHHARRRPVGAARTARQSDRRRPPHS